MRSRIEWAARVVALVALGAAWWMWQFPPSVGRSASNVAVLETVSAEAESDSVLTAIVNTLFTSGQSALRLSVSSVPGQQTRALLHAAQDAGWRVEWRSGVNANFMAANAIAVSATARTDPDGGTVIQVAAPTGTALTLSDSLGWIDSVLVSDRGTYWNLSGDARAFRVASPFAVATVGASAQSPVKRIRLFAATGWESRFLLNALEAAGWTVDADFSIAPRVSVTAGSPTTIDTARYAAVVALDSSAWRQAAAIGRFVRSGGGLVLFPGSARGAALAPLRAGGVGSALAGIPGALRSALPTEGLAFTPVTGLASDAVVMARSAREGAPVAVAARRVGAGRVIQIGFEQTWEWRMLGGDNAVLDHRDWWRSMLQRVAWSSVAAVEERWMPLPGNAAPLADLVARLGPPADAYGPDSETLANAAPPVWLLVVALTALLGEWWSRRLRGAV